MTRLQLNEMNYKSTFQMETRRKERFSGLFSPFTGIVREVMKFLKNPLDFPINHVVYSPCIKCVTVRQALTWHRYHKYFCMFM